eukprot:1375770-Karenia_brevis.AAC.1
MPPCLPVTPCSRCVHVKVTEIWNFLCGSFSDQSPWAQGRALRAWNIWSPGTLQNPLVAKAMKL